MVIERKDVKEEDTWDVKSLYTDLESWENEFSRTYQQSESPVWRDIHQYKGKLHQSEQYLKETFEIIFSLERRLTKLYTYAHLRNDENLADDDCKKAFSKATSAYYELAKETAWFEPEILLIDDATLKKYLVSDALKDYRFHLEKIVRLKENTLSKDEI